MRRFALFLIVAVLAASIPAQVLTAKEIREEKMHDPWVQKRLVELGERKHPAAWLLTVSTAPGDQANCKWAARLLEKMDSVRVGTTRGQLLKVPSPSGGISSTTQQTFVAPICPFIKVDVRF
jgi:hypothetical protein